MGKTSSPDIHLRVWDECTQDPTLRDLPYKLEVNVRGKVEMSPASVRHSLMQGMVGAELSRQLPDGVILPECPVLTDIGVRVPDVAWASRSFMNEHGRHSPLRRAPEICVEIISRSNVEAEITGKTRAYLKAGAREVWLVTEDGTVRFMDHSGEKSRSGFSILPVLPDLTKGYL